MKQLMSNSLLCAIFFLIPSVFGFAEFEPELYEPDMFFEDTEADPVQPPARIVVTGDNASQPVVVIQTEFSAGADEDKPPPPPLPLPLPEGFPADPNTAVSIRVIISIDGQDHVFDTNVSKNPSSESPTQPPPPRMPPQVSAPTSRFPTRAAARPAAPEPVRSAIPETAVPPPEPVLPSPSHTDRLYFSDSAAETGLNRVQVGSFAIPVLAQNYFNSLRIAGFTAAAIEHEHNQNVYRVVIPGVRPADVPHLVQRLRYAGFDDIWIRREP